MAEANFAAETSAQSNSSAVNRDIDSDAGSLTLCNSVDEIIVNLNWFIQQFSNINIKSQEDYYILLTAKNEIEQLKAKYSKISKQLTSEESSPDKSSHFKILNKFIVTLAEMTAKLASFENQMSSNQNTMPPVVTFNDDNTAVTESLIPFKPIDKIVKTLDALIEVFNNYNVKTKSNYQELLKVQAEVEQLREKYEIINDQLACDERDTISPSHLDILKKFIFFSANINAHLASFIEKSANEPHFSVPPVASQPSASNQTVSAPPPQLQSFKLPEIPLPSFSGNFQSWLDFRSAFSTIVIDNPTVPDDVKYVYLKQVLSGEALNRIANAPSGNFKLAWASLKERYDNPMLIADTHVAAILSPPTLNAKSAASWRAFIDHTKLNIDALETLDFGMPIKDLLFMYILISRFDVATLRDWERYNSLNDKPSLSNLWTFMESQHKIAQAVSFSFPNNPQHAHNPHKGHQGHQQTNKPVFQSANNNNSNSNKVSNFNNSFPCQFCRDVRHKIFACTALLKLSPAARLGAIKSKSLCFNCIKPYSREHECSGSCKICGQSHHTVLHDSFSRDNQQSKNTATTNAVQTRSVNGTSKHQLNSSSVNSMQDSAFGASHSSISHPVRKSHTETTDSHAVVNSACNVFSKPNHRTSVSIIPTAELIVTDAQGQAVACRALLDTGSDSCLISENLAMRLGLPPLFRNSLIHTVSNNSTRSTVVHSVTVKSSDQTWSSTVECLVVNEISLNLPPFNLDMTTFEIPHNLKLADPYFYQSRSIDILLGASVFAAIMSRGQILLDPSSPILQNTALGWIIFGSLQLKQPSVSTQHFHSNFISSLEISNQIEKFWKLEELSPIVPPSPEAVKVEQHYAEHTIRLEDGRFMVSLPRRDNFFTLGQSEFQARKRFSALEAKFVKYPKLKEQYTAFMDEYQELGHMTPVSPPNLNEKTYYIPHHAVFKPDSTTTKLRVVFDASAKTNTGTSLNELLYKGPTVQPDLFDIVLRFRIHRVAFTADTTKMYRQVVLHPDDRNYHRIFWRSDPAHPVQEFCLNTVTYGTAPAAFLATRTLNKVAEMESHPDSPVFKSIHRDFYVDDCISGGPTVEEATQLAQELIVTLDKGGFELRKFHSSSTMLIDSIPSHLVETSEVAPVSDADSGVSKALGLYWNSNSDQLSVDTNINHDPQKSSFTKRELLSVIASIYDPLGLVSPVVVLPKIILQKLWLHKLDWDDKLPPGLLVEWLTIYRQLPDIAQIEIPRCVLTMNSSAVIELHGFSDASSSAYGACIYVRSVADEVQTRLLCSKSRLAPLKVLSIPKLELQAALLLARLVNRVLHAFQLLDIGVSQVFLWSDSTTVCNWIRAIPDRKDIFVAVRVAEIQETTSQFNWSHVKGSHNPADIVSRGSVPSELSKNNSWWHGPSWLSKSQSHWDSFSSHFMVSMYSNVFAVNCVINSIIVNLILRISKYNKLIRTFACVLRFIHNLRRPLERVSGELLVSEIVEAEIIVIKSVQEEAFGSELFQLRSKEELNAKSTIHALTPFIHEDGLLRVGGRLRHADVPFDFQHQILLPAKHDFTKALVISIHEQSGHAGVQATMASLRQRFWIPATRRAVKSILRTCIKCFRFSHVRSEQVMGQLPAVRVGVSSPFSNVGVDYMGPINLRLGGPKSRTLSKAHIALFVCMVTRAVHLEVVSELSTKAFLSALTRFVSIRGIPNSIHSDNGTAFTGANNELQELYRFLSDPSNQDSIQHSAANLRIQWNFIPPRAPHFGGLWERSIRSFKSIFRIVTFKQTLNFEEIFTLSAQIGATLNSRPIVPLSEDPHDLAYLSPGHFLIGRPLNSLPVKRPQTKHINHLDRWLKIAEFNRQLWERWSQEYLVTLQKLSKWTSTKDNIAVGTLVLLKDPGSPPSVWKLGRITEVICGIDNKVRVVMVLTDSGIFKRTVVNIAPLPLDNMIDDDHI